MGSGRRALFPHGELQLLDHADCEGYIQEYTAGQHFCFGGNAGCYTGLFQVCHITCQLRRAVWNSVFGNRADDLVLSHVMGIVPGGAVQQGLGRE